MVVLPPGLPVIKPVDILYNGSLKEATGRDQRAVNKQTVLVLEAKSNSTSAVTEERADLANRRLRMSCQRNLEVSFYQKGGTWLRQKDEDPQEGTQAETCRSKQLPEILHDMGISKDEKLEADADLERSRTIYQDKEKMLVP